jgi:Integrase zinc binding domain
LVDVSCGVFCPLVPVAFRRQIFNSKHGLAHPGIRATRRLIASRFVWPNLAAAIKSSCQDCQQCQAAKVTRQPASPVHSIPVPAIQFSHLHINVVGPLPAAAAGYSHCRRLQPPADDRGPVHTVGRSCAAALYLCGGRPSASNWAAGQSGSPWTDSSRMSAATRALRYRRRVAGLLEARLQLTYRRSRSREG